MKLIPIRSDIREEIRTHLQKLVDAIESGEYVGYLSIALKPDGTCTIFQCAPNVPVVQSIGAVTILQQELLKEVKEI